MDLALSRNGARLRTVTPDDAIVLSNLARDHDLAAFGDPHWRPLGPDDFPGRAFRAGTADRLDVVIDFPSRGVIGTACLQRIDWRNRVASIGLSIYDPSCRRLGVGIDTVSALKSWAVNFLALRRLEAQVLADNDASIAMLKKAEFRREGVLRERYLRDGNYLDVVCLGWLSID